MGRETSPVFPLIVTLGYHMVKKITNITVILLLAVRLLALEWPNNLPQFLALLSVIILSIAGGIALANLLHGAEKQ